MKDPYEVLGVDRTASEEEIKAAYRELVKKYHPDRYQNNPLADLAKEKLQEVNEAYDAITRGKAGGYSGGTYNGSYGGNSSGNSGSYSSGSSGSYSSGSYGSSSNPEMQAVRNMINVGNLMGAKKVLERASTRDAEWFFLNGVIASRYGKFDEAVSNVTTAVNMEPANMEYRQTLNAITSAGTTYRQASNTQGYDSDSLFKCCAAYACFDCACPCI